MANLRARSPKSAAEIVAEAPKWLNPLLTLLQELRETSMPLLKKTQKTRPWEQSADSTDLLLATFNLVRTQPRGKMQRLLLTQLSTKWSLNLTWTTTTAKAEVLKFMTPERRTSSCTETFMNRDQTDRLNTTLKLPLCSARKQEPCVKLALRANS